MPVSVYFMTFKPNKQTLQHLKLNYTHIPTKKSKNHKTTLTIITTARKAKFCRNIYIYTYIQSQHPHKRKIPIAPAVTLHRIMRHNLGKTIAHSIEGFPTNTAKGESCPGQYKLSPRLSEDG